MSTAKYTGECLCGAVRLTISSEPQSVAECHCEHCRKGAGGIGQVVSVEPTYGSQLDPPLSSVFSNHGSVHLPDRYRKIYRPVASVASVRDKQTYLLGYRAGGVSA